MTDSELRSAQEAILKAGTVGDNEVFDAARAALPNDLKGFWSTQALGLACAQGHLAFIDHLLASGVDPGSGASGLHDSPLMIAARIGQIEVAERLIAAGANVNYFEYGAFGLTALNEAEDAGQTEMCVLLRGHGAIKDRDRTS